MWLVRLYVGVGHVAESRDGRDRPHGRAPLGERVDLVLHGLAQVDVLLARLFQGQLGMAPAPAAPLTDDLRA
jgi:hypothetical protein